MPTDPNATGFEWETVEVPLARGADPRSPGRAAEPSSLLVAQNVRFSDGNFGLERRRGHNGWTVRTQATLDGSTGFTLRGGGGNPETAFIGSGGDGAGDGTVAAIEGRPTGPSDDWLFGVGPVTGGDGSDADTPNAGYLAGACRAGTEALLWDGFRFFAYPSPTGTSEGAYTTEAVMPHAVTRPVARYPQNMHDSDAAVNGRVTVVASIRDGTVTYDVLDTATGAPISPDNGIALSTPLQVRCVAVGEWVHVFASSATTLVGKSFHAGDPWNARDFATTLPDCDTYFDVRVLDDETFALVVRDTSDAALLYRFNADGTEHTTIGSLNLDGANPAANVAIGWHPGTGRWCLAWYTTGGVLRVREYTAGGTATGSSDSAGSIAGLTNLTVEAEFLTLSDVPTWRVFHSEDAGTTSVPLVQSRVYTGGALSTLATRRRAALTHQAFRVGNGVYVGVRHEYEEDYRPGVQQSYFFCDANIQPLARLEYGTASDGRAHGVHSVCPFPGQGTQNRTVWHAALPYRVRVDSEDNDQFDEVGVKVLDLDFLPPLRSADHGLTTYFPGGCLWQYDGREVTEAGHLYWPEKVRAGVVVGGGTGALAHDSVYRYRVRAVYKNARGEEFLSAGLLTDEVTVPASPSADRTIRITVPTVQWSRRDLSLLGFLVYRNESNGVQWYLVSSRDPDSADYFVNDPTTNEVTWDDDGSVTDTELLSLERDPGNVGPLEPFTPPASTVIGAGRDRVWLAGGEIARGDLLPSLTRSAGVGAGFNGFLTTSATPGRDVTGFGFMGHSALVFTDRDINAFEADGPSNLGVGAFDAPRVVTTDLGLVPGSPAPVIGPQGLYFVSETGPALLAQNLQVVRIGDRVRALSDGVTGLVVSPADQEVRFYRRDGEALVFCHDRGEWLLWTGLEAQGAVPFGDGALIARSNGVALVETEGVWRDGGRGYRARVRTAWLGPAQDGFQRVRRFSLLGDLPGSGVELRFRAYYDDRDFTGDSWEWAPDDDATVADGEWGDGTWGSGAWGDPGSPLTANEARRDRVLRVRRGLARQKCSRVSVEWWDNSPNNAGARFSAVSLEVGRRPGLNRGPVRTLNRGPVRTLT